ncbi:MAG TPA: 5-dehydro-2-deoxygluconokinase [Calditerricola sp.]
MGAEVYTFGRVIVDLYAEQLHTPLQHVKTFRKYLGGSAGNMAVGLARLGARAGLISRVGADAFGEFLLDRLRAEGIDTAMVRRDERFPTGLAFAAIFPPHDSTVLFYRKPCADIKVEIADLDLAALRQARMLVLTGTALSESPSREAALRAAEEVRGAGGTVVFDLDWRPMFWPSLEEARVVYRLALRLSDAVLANEPELEMAGESRDPFEAADRLRALGPSVIVAKRGGEGALLFHGDKVLRVHPLPVNVVNTLGAGDGFWAAFCYGLLQGWSPARCLEFANAAGAIVVSRHSCSEAMPARKEVEALLRDHQMAAVEEMS